MVFTPQTNPKQHKKGNFNQREWSCTLSLLHNPNQLSPAPNAATISVLSSGRRGDHSLAANTAYLANVSASTEGFVGLSAQHHHHHRHQSLHGLLTAAAASAAAGSAAAAAAAAAASLDSPRSLNSGDDQPPESAAANTTQHQHQTPSTNTFLSVSPRSDTDITDHPHHYHNDHHPTSAITVTSADDAIDAAARMQPTLPTQTNAGSADMDLPAVQSMDWLFKKDKLLLLTQFWQQVSPIE